MCRTCGGVAKNGVYLAARAAQQSCEWSVGGFLPPISEQMENEKQWRRFGSLGGRERQKRIDLAKEDRDHLGALLRCGLQRLFWQTL